MLNRNYAVIVERYAWSGTVYSWALNPDQDPSKYMLVDVGYLDRTLRSIFTLLFQKS